MTCDDFPFDLYCVNSYDRMRLVRAAMRKFQVEEIEAALAEAVKDDCARSIVKRLKEDYRDFSA